MGREKTTRKDGMEKCSGFTRDARVMSEIQEHICSSLGHLRKPGPSCWIGTYLSLKRWHQHYVPGAWDGSMPNKEIMCSLGAPESSPLLPHWR